jgi:AcrR family transcriptional regulator
MEEENRGTKNNATGDELEAKIARLEQAVLSKDTELSALKGSLSGAVARYREALLASAPDIPGELVKGATVEEIDASLEQARGIVARVRQQLEAQTEAKRVPAGAPPRLPQDLSALTAAEKIAYALGKS